VKSAFKGSPQFVVTVDKACRKIVNENPVNKKNSNKSPEMLAKYCDNLLKKVEHYSSFDLSASLLITFNLRDLDKRIWKSKN